MLQISSELICGFNPCKITTCTVDPDAKCVTDYRCNPIFINAAGQRISGCTGKVDRTLIFQHTSFLVCPPSRKMARKHCFLVCPSVKKHG